RVLSLLFRVAFLLLLGLGLSRLVRTAETNNVCTVVLVDVSDSVPKEALDDARAEVERLYAAKRSDDELKLVTFAKRPRLVPLVEKEGRLALVLTRHASEKGADKERDKPG